jgi:hypothetical protein
LALACAKGTHFDTVTAAPPQPYISDLNSIFPGERVLIPDSYMETVSGAQLS